jgi:hypothetical protein
MVPLSLYQMLMQPQRPQQGPQQGPQPGPPQGPQQGPQPSPQQRWFDLISRPPADPGAPPQRPTNPYEAMLNMTQNAGMQGPPPQQQPTQPGQVVQQGQDPYAYRRPQNSLGLAQMGLGLLAPRDPYGR